MLGAGVLSNLWGACCGVSTQRAARTGWGWGRQSLCVWGTPVALSPDLRLQVAGRPTVGSFHYQPQQARGARCQVPPDRTRLPVGKWRIWNSGRTRRRGRGPPASASSLCRLHPAPSSAPHFAGSRSPSGDEGLRAGPSRAGAPDPMCWHLPGSYTRGHDSGFARLLGELGVLSDDFCTHGGGCRPVQLTGA